MAIDYQRFSFQKLVAPEETVALRVFRFDPDQDTRPRFDTFDVKVRGGMTVLEALFEVLEKQDGSLAFRYACRGAVCGSCAMYINGSYGLACQTQIADLKNIKGGDTRFYNNVFVEAERDIPNRNDPKAERKDGYGLEVYNAVELTMQMDGNVYYNGANPCISETDYIEKPDFDPKIEIVEQGENVYLHITLDESFKSLHNKLVTTKLLGKALVPDLAYENPDGSPLKIDTDYFANMRNDKNPTVGPFENPGQGRLSLKVWPLVQR